MGFALVFFVSMYRKKQLQSQLEIEQIKTRHQQQMLAATIDSIEEERARMGTELHDSVGAMLSTIKLHLQVTSKQNPSNNEVLDELNKTINSVRSISHEMMPVVLKKYGLLEGVKEITTKVKIPEIKMHEWDHDLKFNENQSLMIFRIIQEGLNNVYKHANAKEVRISVLNGDETSVVRIQDDGKGFKQNVIEESKGMGLLNMESRAQIIESEISFFNSETGGAVIELVVPKE